MFLVNSRLALLSATSSGSTREVLHPTKAILLPKLRMYFAEFLNHRSPDRLGILYLPTCVGLGYGQSANSLEAFLGSMGLVTSTETSRHRVSGCTRPGFAWTSPYTLTPGQPTPGITYPPASPLCCPPRDRSVRSRRSSPLESRFGMGADTVVLEYQPVVHRLRLSASP